MRKMQAVVFATSLLILVSQLQPFGEAFLYFPIAASVVSVGFFVYDLVELGGASYINELTGVNPKGNKRLKEQQENEAKSKTYFDNRKDKKNTWKSIFIE